MKVATAHGYAKTTLLILRVLGLIAIAIGIALLLLPERSPVSHDAVGVAMILLGVAVVQVWLLLGHAVGRIDDLEAEIASLRREAS